MRTDGIQDSALFPSHSPIPGPGVPALALSLLTCLRPTGGRELCLSDLPCPIQSLCWLIPGACCPETCPGHLGSPEPCFPPCVLGSDGCRSLSVWAAQGNIRAPLGMLLENHVVLLQCQSFPVPLLPQFPQQTHVACGTEDRRYEFRPKVLWSICGVGKAPVTAQASI